MKNKLLFLICSVFGNALGTALMTQTGLGLTAWGSAAKNVADFYGITFGTAFIIIALIFYGIALIMQKKVEIMSTFMSLAFLITFGLLSDVLIHWIPDMTGLLIQFRIIINFLGLCVLLLSIALHLNLIYIE